MQLTRALERPLGIRLSPLATRAAIGGALVWSALAVGYVASAVAEEAAARPAAVATEFFEKAVRPVLVQRCYECHSAREVSGGLALDVPGGALTGGDSGAAIIPGEPDKSRLIEAIRYQNPDLQMPPKHRLSAAEVAVLEKWVAMGAPDPRQPAAAGDSAAPTGMSIEDGRNFWSFKPVVKPPLPAVRNRDWARTPIDAFVLAALEASGLQPAPPADKRTLIRRVTFDLIGLPPTPQEVDAFLADESPEAFASVVERLLSSPGYGIRWGRHWLDVARYADSNGLDENLAFGNAWRYRDYVIDAFNRDEPFDRFLIEQIAGDLLPGADQKTKTATGFLVLGAKVLAEPDRQKLDMDIVDEQLDTLGKVFLGMTLGCVRCHDHKFDPIKQTDYYGLAAIFKSTKTLAGTNHGSIKHWHEYSIATQDELANLKGIDAKITEKKRATSAFKNAAVDKLRRDARAKATEYLAASARFDPSMPLTAVEEIAKPLGIHPHILHHCRLHLEYHQDDAFFGTWHELAAAGDIDGIEQHFRPLFDEAEAALAAARKTDPKAGALADNRLEPARAALYDPAGFLAVPSKPEFAFDAATLAEYHRLAEEWRIVESSSPDSPGVMGVADGEVLSALPIHVRGSHRNLGKPVPRDFPEVMRGPSVRPDLPGDHSGRLELARWMADRQHPLTARVHVNRVWRWHFGAGIVGSTENFGKLGDRPSHPELLDWLARHFIDSDWSTKDLHRLMLCSSTYQMSSAHPHDPDALRIDPEIRLLWKFRMQRLEAEQLRDAILAVSGRLDASMGGKTIPLRNRQFVFDHTSVDHTKYDSLRRAVYLPVVRNNLYTLFEQYDFPDPTMPTGSRNSTIVAPQALLLMNSELIMDSADEFAGLLLDQSGDDAGRVRSAYERALGRPPAEAETQRALAFVDELLSRRPSFITADKEKPQTLERAPVSRLQAWSLLCQSLFASNEFMYVR